MSKHYLVTGGAGFIGSHLVEALLIRGDRVRILDDFSTGKEENVPAGIEVLRASVADQGAVAKACQGVEGIFHLAAYPNVQFSIEYPRETNEVNLTGTLNVLLAARDAGVKRVVYSASSAAYGDQETMPLQEELKPNPKSPYGLQKYVGEEYCRMASLFFGVETVSLRYFNVYGPRLSFKGAYVTVIAVFLKQHAAGAPLTITSDGTQTRDFVYIDDVVQANLLAMETREVGKGEVINIGTGVSRSVNEIAQRIGGPTVNIAPRVEPHDTLADVRRAKRLLGWAPSVVFEEGIKGTVEWFERSGPKE